MPINEYRLVPDLKVGSGSRQKVVYCVPVAEDLPVGTADEGPRCDAPPIVALYTAGILFRILVLVSHI